MNRDTIPNPQSGDYRIMQIGLGNQESPEWHKVIPPQIPPGWRAFVRWNGVLLELGIEKIPGDEAPAKPGAVDLNGKSKEELMSMAGMKSIKYDAKTVTKTDLIAMLSK